MLKIYYFIFVILTVLIILGYTRVYKYYESINNNKQSINIIERNDVYIVKDIIEEPFVKNIVQTYKSKDKVPPSVITSITENNIGWKYHFFDDEDIKKFLLENYDKIVLDKFNSFKQGAHKADLFRLCWLYINGGVYIDIDVELIKSLDYIIENKNYDLAIPISFEYGNSRVFNAIIISNKGNKQIKKCIENIMKVNQDELQNNYLLLLHIMQNTLKNNYNHGFTEKNNSVLITSVGTWGIYKENVLVAYSKYKNYKNW